MPKRNRYDLSHYSFMSGKIGRLMTLSAIPVVAGDSVMLNMAGAFRLSPLRRDLSLDAMIDLFAFYVPHRHVYGDDWIDFIQGGPDETVTFPGIGSNYNDTIAQYLGYNRLDSSMPLYLPAGYNMIWNRYFRIPNSSVAEQGVTSNATNLLFNDAEIRNFGLICARLRTFPTTGNTGSDFSDDDLIYYLTTGLRSSGIEASLNLTELDRHKSILRSELERKWFGIRYTDMLDRIWGGYASTDADQRPTLLMRDTQWMSGFDVDGTGDANLGQYAGKAATVLDMNLPRKFFPEHGTLWLMALVRFPTIWEKEVHYLVRKPNPTYEEIGGDGHIIANRTTHVLNRWEVFSGVAATDTVTLGQHPYGQWYRYHPSVVHSRFDELHGFPFLPYNPSNATEAQYHRNGDYDDVFATSQLGHWRSQLRVNCVVDRVVPGPLSSIFTGV